MNWRYDGIWVAVSIPHATDEHVVIGYADKCPKANTEIGIENMVCFLLQKLGKDEEQFVVDLKTGKVYKGMLILACDVSTPKSYGC